jgi:hypothetical protein
MRLRRVLPFSAALVCALAAAPAPAGAQSAPRFSTLDRVDDTSRFILEYGRHFFDEAGAFDMSAYRIDLAGQYAGERFGAFGHVGLSGVTFEGSGRSESYSGMTALELGGFYHAALGGGLAVVRASLVLPNADDEFEGRVANSSTGFQRLTDLVDGLGAYWGPRVSGSWSRRGSSYYTRFDLGLDTLSDADDDRPPNESMYVVARFDAGLGVLAGDVSAGLEWVNVLRVDDDDDGDSMDFEKRHINSAALRLAWLGTYVQPALTIITPLDDSVRGEVLVAMLGVDVLGLP